jgi:hypothetical protein
MFEGKRKTLAFASQCGLAMKIFFRVILRGDLLEASIVWDDSARKNLDPR